MGKRPTASPRATLPGCGGSLRPQGLSPERQTATAKGLGTVSWKSLPPAEQCGWHGGYGFTAKSERFE